MLKYIFIAFTLLAATTTWAQNPLLISIKGIGGNKIDKLLPKVVPTNDGGFVLSMSVNSTTGNINTSCVGPIDEMNFQKYNADGTTMEWEKCYSEKDSMYLFLLPTSNGNILGGTSNSDSAWGYLISKEDALGNIVWSKYYSKGNGPIPRDMTATADGGYIMFGEANNIDTNATIHYGSVFSNDLLVLKVNSNGNKIWSKVFGGSDYESAVNVLASHDGGCYIVANTISNDHDCNCSHSIYTDVLLVRLDKDGQILWRRCLGGTGSDVASMAVTDNDENILIVGRTQSTDGDVHYHIGDNDIWALQVDSAGNLKWENCYGSPVSDLGRVIDKSDDGSIWIGALSATKQGQIPDSFGKGDAWLIHTDSIGTFLGSRVLGGSEDDDCKMIHALPDHKVLLGGSYYGPGAPGSGFVTTWQGDMDIFLATLVGWPTSIPEEVINNETVKMYPNPATTQLYIDIKESTANEEHNIVITDVLGRAVYRDVIKRGFNQAQVQVSDWARGMYFVQVAKNGEKGHVQRVVVE